MRETIEPKGSLKRSNAAKKGVQLTFPSKAQERKTRIANASTTPAAGKTVAKKLIAKPRVEKKAAAKKTVTRKT
jgi:hypothetical protein